MKTKNLFLLAVLIALLNSILAGRVRAQTFTTLHSFTAPDLITGTNGDGFQPYAGLVTNLSGNTLYGTAEYGGSSGNGTVFAVNTDGTGFTNLYSFTATACFGCSNSDGAHPNAGLILSGNTLYGTARISGSSVAGTVFAVNTDGTGFTNLHSFAALFYNPNIFASTNSDGAYPYAGLVLSGTTLYGTAQSGGSSGNGTLFAVNTNGTGFTNLHSFTAIDQTYYTNGDGANPVAGLIVSGTTLYGTASAGGNYAGGHYVGGTVFAVHSDGTGFTNLHSFNGYDGAYPQGVLVLSGTALYGTTANRTVFAVNADGTGFTNLHVFTATADNGSGLYTNIDGTSPSAGLTLSGNTLYGTASEGGSSGKGTVFAVHTDGTGFTNLFNFTGASDGASPHAALILLGNTLYGTAYQGGGPGWGTVFSLSFRPQLTITPSGTNVILSWPTNVAGFDCTGYILQETANLGSPTHWSRSDFFPPVIVNGQIRLTGPMLGPQRYYRLSQ